MPVNNPLAPPFNTDAKGRPINPKNTKVYWGDEQTLKDGKWSDPTFPKGIPLHLPRVVRFLYAYGATDQHPEEENVIQCDCPPVGDCGDEVCTWNLQFKKVWNGVQVTPKFIENGLRLIGINTGTDVPDKNFPIVRADTVAQTTNATCFLPSYTTSFSDATNGFLQIAEPGPFWEPPKIIYYGVWTGAPVDLITKVYAYIVKWTKSCTKDGLPFVDNKCPQVFYSKYINLGTPKSIGTQCHQTVTVGSVGAFGLDYNGTEQAVGVQWGDPNLTNGVTDYPPYGTACVPGPGPCG